MWSCFKVSWLRGAILFRRSLTFVPDPNGHDPLPDCKHAAELLLSNPEEFKRRARRHMQEVPLCFTSAFSLHFSLVVRFPAWHVYSRLSRRQRSMGLLMMRPNCIFKASMAPGRSARTALSPRFVLLFAVQLRPIHGRLLRKVDVRNKD
jgi:hypothetical protein